MFGGLGCRASGLVLGPNLILVGLGLSGFGISTGSGVSSGFAFSRLDVVVAGVGGGTWMATGYLNGGMLGTVETLLEVVPECAAEDTLEFLVLVVLVEKVKIGLRASKESLRLFDDLTSTAATDGGTLMADIDWIDPAAKSAGSEKLFPESCLPLVRGSSSNC